MTARVRPFSDQVSSFAAAVGGSGRVSVAGGRTAWAIGGELQSDVSILAAPKGVVTVDVAEMTVRVGAGTPVADLDSALAEFGQEVALGGRAGGTVGGALAVGWSDMRRPRVGPSRDVLLEADVVDAGGHLVRCGGPTVKNVTGYDLCRLLVGSLGTVTLVGEVLLRTRPRPAVARWTSGDLDPDLIRTTTLLPSCHLWDGTHRWVLHEGHPADVDEAVRALERDGGRPIDRPPELPSHRWSLDPARIVDLVGDGQGDFLAEVGVGTVHRSTPQPPRPVADPVRALHERLKTLFDPDHRLNPGRDPLAR